MPGYFVSNIYLVPALIRKYITLDKVWLPISGLNAYITFVYIQLSNQWLPVLQSSDDLNI